MNVTTMVDDRHRERHMMKTRTTQGLSLIRSPSQVPPELRGRLLNAGEVSQEIFSGHVSRKYVLEHVPAIYRHKIGRLILFYEGEVRQWIETHRRG